MVTSGHQWAILTKSHDFKPLEFSNYPKNHDKVIKLYKKGLSLREVEKRAHISKTKVRDILIKAKIPLRAVREETQMATGRTRTKKNVKPPYGFCYFDGRVLKHPKEYPVLLSIITRWKSEQSLNSIATWLNGKRIPSPMGKKWSWNSVVNIIQRIKNGQIVQKGEHYELR